MVFLSGIFLFNLFIFLSSSDFLIINWLSFCLFRTGFERIFDSFSETVGIVVSLVLVLIS